MLLDTSGLLCVHHKDESQHSQALTFFQAASTRMTHSYVLAEFVPLCHVRGVPREAALSFVTTLIDNPLVDMIWVDEILHRAALALLQARLDKTYSLCDAVSFLLMRQRSIDEALTTDRHFEQEGFRRLL